MTDLSPPSGGPPHPGDPDEDGAAAVTSLPQDANGAERLSVASWLGRCWLAAVGLVIAVAASWRPGMLPLGRVGQRLELQVPGWLLIALAIAGVAVWLAIVSILIRPPLRKDPDEVLLEPPPPPRLSPVTLLLLGLLLVIAAGGAVLVLQLLDVYHGGGTVAHSVGIGAPPQAVQPAPLRGAARAATLDWGLTVTLGAVAVAIIGGAVLVIAGNEPWTVLAQWFRLGRRRKMELAGPLAAALSAGIHDLDAGDDPRRAVIACYRRCEATLALHRRRRCPAETPREFVADALAALHVPTAPIRSLLVVFERARFSNLPITSRDGDVARHALDDIRSALDRKAQHGTAP